MNVYLYMYIYIDIRTKTNIYVGSRMVNKNNTTTTTTVFLAPRGSRHRAVAAISVDTLRGGRIGDPQQCCGNKHNSTIKDQEHHKTSITLQSVRTSMLCYKQIFGDY